MLQKAFVLLISLTMAFAVASVTQAKDFSLVGGGAQAHIGNGLMLPIQAAATAATTGTVLPNLLVPVAPGAHVVSGTTAKTTLLTAGPKQGYQQALVVPSNVLSKPAGQRTVGVKVSNPTAFAVGTNLNYKWPAAPSTFSTGAAVGIPVVAGHGGTMTYSNALGARFGGPASISIAPGASAGLIATAPVTVYVKVNTTTPACTHPAWAGTDAGCVAGLIIAKPTGLAGIGGPTATSVSTPGGAIAPNVAAVQMGTVPNGTILNAVAVATNTLVPTNAAQSLPGPWTTGQIIISNPAASPVEKFTLSGKDDRTVGGNGTIQLVAGSLSTRGATGPNANRGWLQLKLTNGPGVPAMSPIGNAAIAGLILLAGGYALRRRLSA